jgi:exosortase
MPLWLGLGAMAAPALLHLSRQDWTRDFGAYGPIVLATGAWLLWREASEVSPEGRQGSFIITCLGLLAAIPLFIVGRMLDLATLEVFGVYLAGVSLLHHIYGLAFLRRAWFPLLYLAFVIPPPNSLLQTITAPLKEFVSWSATSALHGAGLPVSREGVTIYVAQYQLLVEDACSGMNSLVGLIAVSLLYIYLMRQSSARYAVFLTVFVIPVAIGANILRIMVLILLTYFAGDEVAQGFLHKTAGLFLFVSALLLVFAADSAFMALRQRLRRDRT